MPEDAVGAARRDPAAARVRRLAAQESERQGRPVPSSDLEVIGFVASLLAREAALWAGCARPRGISPSGWPSPSSLLLGWLPSLAMTSPDRSWRCCTGRPEPVGVAAAPKIEMHLPGDFAREELWNDMQVRTLEYGYLNTGKPTGVWQPGG
jgi:hypothetical protein